MGFNYDKYKWGIKNSPGSANLLFDILVVDHCVKMKQIGLRRGAHPSQPLDLPLNIHQSPHLLIVKETWSLYCRLRQPPFYPKIDDANLKGTLWTFKQWTSLKMVVRYGIFILLLLKSSYKALSGYASLTIFMERRTMVPSRPTFPISTTEFRNLV